MSRNLRSLRFIPFADVLPSRITPSDVPICPMDPVYIDPRLPDNNPTDVNPMDPGQVDVYAFTVTNTLDI